MHAARVMASSHHRLHQRTRSGTTSLGSSRFSPSAYLYLVCFLLAEAWTSLHPTCRSGIITDCLPREGVRCGSTKAQLPPSANLRTYTTDGCGTWRDLAATRTAPAGSPGAGGGQRHGAPGCSGGGGRWKSHGDTGLSRPLSGGVTRGL